MKVSKKVRPRQTIEGSFQVNANHEPTKNIRNKFILGSDLMRPPKAKQSITDVSTVSSSSTDSFKSSSAREVGKLRLSTKSRHDTIPSHSRDDTQDGGSYRVLEGQGAEVGSIVRLFPGFGSKNKVPSFQGWGMKGGDMFHHFNSMGYNWAATSTGLAFKHILGHEPGAVLFI